MSVPDTLQQPSLLKERSLWGDALRRFARNRLAMFGLVVLVILVAMAVLADIVTPYPYDKVDYNIVNLRPFQDPAHILGGDSIGRDYLSRLIYGARTSLIVGLAVPIIAFIIGVPLGAFAGYSGGLIDFFVLRLVEVFTAVPPLLFALFLLSVVQRTGVATVVLVLSITSWIEPLRLTRGQFLAIREKEFVTAARALGGSDWHIISRHVLLNALTPLLVNFTFAVPLAIFAEAALSFLGLGIAEPTPSWGRMVGTSVGTSIQVHPHLAFFPTLLVALTMLSFSFVGDGLQEALDPQRAR